MWNSKRDAFRSVSLILGVICMISGPAWAGSYTNEGVPPVQVTSGSLQDMLNQIFGCADCVDANADQTGAGMWSSSTARKPTSTAVLQFTDPSGSPDTFGIWSSPTSLVPIFLGGDPQGSAVLSWNTAGDLSITSTDPADDCGVTIDCQSGISSVASSGFGFYMSDPGTPGGGTFSTIDSLNPSGAVQALTYNSANEWILAFNDTQVTGANPGTYDSMVVGVQSIAALPEPRSIILLGTALLVVFSFARYRNRKESIEKG